MDGSTPEFDRLSTTIEELDQQAANGDAAGVLAELATLECEVAASPLQVVEQFILRFMLSSVMINVAADIGDDGGLVTGLAWAVALAEDDSLPPDFRGQARLNQANGLLARYELAERHDPDGSVSGSANPEYRLANMGALRDVRAIYSTVGNDQAVPPECRSMALCNQANALDESGRWVEAYAAYSDALAHDPDNGNAAGNLAELLRRRLTAPGSHRGHIAAAYNLYLRLAQSLNDRTVSIAGAAAAQRWKDLVPSEREGHLSHGGNPRDPYQRWIVDHRLALAPTLEGLGSDGERWDSANVSAVSGPPDQVPRVFAACNVLKAEFLVARRLAFRGITMIEESEIPQHPDDSGVYTDTLDGGIYGEGPATLLLAQRSALDVLDKIAVTANEHFATGLSPSKVSFRAYWKDEKTGRIRPDLPPGSMGRRALLALAELATDIDKGMYVAAQLLRNAGTHRLVHITFGLPTGPTKETFSSVDVDELQAATVTALWVVRAAYLYLIDLLESQAPHESSTRLTVPNQL
jgi:tetratricopeptide (TPR) repeat protein